MNTRRLALFVTAIALLGTTSAYAQRGGARPRVSPHETIEATAGGNKVSIAYGRPFAKNPRGEDIRKVWGALVPYGQAWRIGADEATQITLEKGIKIGDAAIPAGTYTLYLVPEEKGGKLAFSKTVGKWGIPVDEKNDLVRVDVTREALSPAIDQLALAIDPTANGGVIKIMWEGAQYKAAFTNQ